MCSWRRSRRRAARSDARRLRLAADAAGRRGDRVHARRPRGRVRLEPRRDRQGGVLDEQRRLVGPGGRRDGEEADAESGRRRAAASSRRRQVHDRPRAAASRLRVGSLVSRRLRSRDRHEARPCSRRPICRSSDFTLSPDGGTIVFTAVEARATDNLYRVPLGGRRAAAASRRAGRSPRRRSVRLRRVLEVVADGAGGALPRGGARRLGQRHSR